MAKLALKDQLMKGIYNINCLRIDLEPKFCMDGFILFIPDLAVYDHNGLRALFEIVVSNPISEKKRKKMEYYFFCHGYYPEIIEIKADEILNKIVI